MVKKTKCIGFKVTKHQHKQLKEIAGKFGESVTGIVLKQLKKNKELKSILEVRVNA